MDSVTITRSLAMNKPAGGAIVVVRGENIGKIVRIQPDTEIFLGRDSNVCDLYFQGNKISRKHCGIIYHAKENVYSIQDYSANGTFWPDGNRLNSQSPNWITPGTEIWLATKKDAIRLG
ncbi:MAG: FHA domain-containing protein [Lachnospiraceae bacterium]|nr:FHA domain-containing protein [Lachnospiraceae bacterium]